MAQGEAHLISAQLLAVLGGAVYAGGVSVQSATVVSPLEHAPGPHWHSGESASPLKQWVTLASAGGQ